MRDKEAQEFIASLFPIGKERWLKIKYLDEAKCLKAFRTDGDDADRLGYEVISIGIRDEYEPQVAAMLELKADFARFQDRLDEHIEFIKAKSSERR